MRLHGVRDEARHARAEVTPQWETARKLFRASPLVDGVADVDGFLMEVLEGASLPRECAARDGAIGVLFRRYDRLGFADPGGRGKRLLAELLVPAEMEAARDEVERVRTKLEVMGTRRREPKQMPEWIGAVGQDVEEYCWLSNPARLQETFTTTNRDLQARVDAEDVAHRVHRWIRYNVVADLPDPERLVMTVQECLAENFPDYVKEAGARQAPQQSVGASSKSKR